MTRALPAKGAQTLKSRQGLLALGLLALAILVRVPTLAQKLIEHHTFRQTQTAWTAEIYAQEGVNLLHPKVPVVGPPFEIPFEFPAFQAAASVLLHTGLDRDIALRIAGLLSFLLAGWLLWLLLRRLLSDRAALIALLLFTTTPLSLMFGRAVLVDYLALAAGIAFAYAALRWIDGRGWGWLVLAVVVGGLAAMIKLPTFVAWPIVVLAYWWERVADRRGARDLALLVVLILLPVVPGLLWTLHADGIKAASAITAGQTSAALSAWNFGTLAQRLDWHSWVTEGSMLAGLTIGLGWLPALLLTRAGARRIQRSKSVAGLLIAGLLPPLIFFNLYVVHEYYWIAVSAAWAALAAVGLDELWQRFGPRALPAIGLAMAISLVGSVLYWGVAYNQAPVGGSAFLDQAAEIDAFTAPDELVVVAGDSWMPTALYYAQRWGLAIPLEVRTEDIAPTRDLYSGLSLRDPATMDLGVLAIWSWVAPVGRQTYRLGASFDALPDAAVKWTPAQSNIRLGVQTAGTLPVECTGHDVPLPIPLAATERELRIVLSGSKALHARVWVGKGLAPLPAHGVVIIPAGYPKATLSCDQGSLEIVGVYLAP